MGKDTESTTRALAQDLEEALQWGEENAIAFAPDKYELIHFARKRGSATPSIRVPARNIDITPRQTPMRWLGVYFDQKLDFHYHTEHWAAKGWKVAQHLRALNKVCKGLPPAAAVKAVKACVLPKVLYGAEVWAEGEKRPSIRDPAKIVKSQQGKHIRGIDRAVRLAVRAALPVWCTTPATTLYREAGIPPAEVLLAQTRKRASLRLKLLDERHPLTRRIHLLEDARERAKGNTNPRQRREDKWSATHLLRLSLHTERCERPELLPLKYQDTPDRILQGKVVGLAAFNRLCDLDPPGTLYIYSDGSGMQGKTGWAFVAYKGPTWVHQNSGSLPKAEVFDAEARGTAEGLQWAREECQKGRRPLKVVLCIENTPVIRGIEGHTPLSSQGYFQSIKSNQRWLEVFLVKLETRWTPGHVGIPGNELAKKATLLAREEQQLATVSWARRQNRQERKQMFADWWAKNCPPPHPPTNTSTLQ